MIRPSTYRAKPGFTVTGRDQDGCRFRIFAKTRDGAELIAEAAKRGDHATVNQLLIAGR